MFILPHLPFKNYSIDHFLTPLLFSPKSYRFNKINQAWSGGIEVRVSTALWLRCARLTSVSVWT